MLSNHFNEKNVKSKSVDIIVNENEYNMDFLIDCPVNQM